MQSNDPLASPPQETQDRDLDLAYKQAIKHLNALSSENFFTEAAQQLALAVDTRYVMITQYHRSPISKLKTLSFWDTDEIKDNFEFMPDDTPCGEVIEGDGKFHYFSNNIQALFPKAQGLVNLNAVSYAAAPIFNANHTISGHVAILDTKPLHNEAWTRSLLEAYASFSGLELERRQTQETITALTKGYGLPLGKDCFKPLTQIAADTFDLDFAFIGQQSSPNSRSIELVALYHRGEFLDPFTYSLDNAPCDSVAGKQAKAFPADLQRLYPDCALLQQLNAQAYIGTPLFDSNNEPIGVFGLIHQKPIEQADRIKTLLEAFGTKAAYEIERLNNEQALQYYSEIVSTTDDFMSLIDSNYTYRAVNQSYCAQFDRAMSDIVNHSVEELHGSQTFQILKRHIDTVLNGGKTTTAEFWREFPDGSMRFIQGKHSPYYDSKQNIIGVSIVARDITELKQTQDALANSQQRLQSLYDDTPSMFFTLGKDRIIKSVNAYGARELGYQVDEFIGKPVYDLFYPDDVEQLTLAINSCFTELGAIQHWELRKKHKDGTTIWVKETARLVHDQAGNEQLFIVSEDISERHKLSQKLSYQASHDALTGLINRHEFERRTQQLLDTVVEDDAHHVMCYLDLDQFKVVNDSCGHLAGDTLLKNISSLLNLKIRRGDTLARLGGDEFGILMTHCSMEQAKTLADAIREVIQDFNFIWQEKTYSIGASIGLVGIDKNTDSITTIMCTVDTACYAAKDAGRNRIIVYSETDQEVSQRLGDMGWIRRINEAIEHNKFRLYCQRIVAVDPANDDQPSYELLLRLYEDNGDIISPNTFLPAAERYHLATKIDQWVIQHSFKWLAGLGSKINNFRYCTINLSGNSLDDAEFLTFVIFQAEKSHIPLNKICFEITETAAISNLAGAIKFMHELAKRGCFFALDDFGSGVSSFGYLKNLAVDFIKIDGSFVKDSATDPIDYAMVKSINDIAHVMGKKTIAEYVENDTIMTCLQEIGVDYAQGFGIGRPQPIDDIL